VFYVCELRDHYAGAAVNSVSTVLRSNSGINNEVAHGGSGVSHDGKWLLDKYNLLHFLRDTPVSAVAFFGVLGLRFAREWVPILGRSDGWSRISSQCTIFGCEVGGVIGLFFAQSPGTDRDGCLEEKWAAKRKAGGAGG